MRFVVVLGILFGLSAPALADEQRLVQPRFADCHLAVQPQLTDIECSQSRAANFLEFYRRRINYGTGSTLERDDLPRTCSDLLPTTDLTSYVDTRSSYLRSVALRTCGTLRFLFKAKPSAISHLTDKDGRIDLDRILAADVFGLEDMRKSGVSDIADDASFAAVNRHMTGEPNDTSWWDSDVFMSFLALGDIDEDGREDGLAVIDSQARGGSLRGFRLYIASQLPGEKFYRLKEFELKDF